MGALGYRIPSIAANSVRHIEFIRKAVRGNEEHNECELVKNGKILIGFEFPEH